LALDHLAAHVRITGLSAFYRSPAVSPHPQPTFGRHRTADRNAPRTIDLDLLLYDDLVLQIPELTLPDPHILDRAFIAVPLAELAPDLLLPGAASSVREIAARLGRAALEPLPQLSRQLASSVRPPLSHKHSPKTQ